MKGENCPEKESSKEWQKIIFYLWIKTSLIYIMYSTSYNLLMSFSIGHCN